MGGTTSKALARTLLFCWKKNLKANWICLELHSPVQTQVNVQVR
jgi:hypothetical protein